MNIRWIFVQIPFVSETEDCKISANDDEIDVNDDCELESANADIDLSVTSSLAQVLEKLISQGKLMISSQSIKYLCCDLYVTLLS